MINSGLQPSPFGQLYVSPNGFWPFLCSGKALATTRFARKSAVIYYYSMWSYSHDKFTVHQIPALQDNYIYLIETGDVLACVDPAEAMPVKSACEVLGKSLTHILNTHHHRDHVGGNLELKARYGCTVIGPSCDQARIPGLDQPASEGIPLRIGNLNVSILFVPGHTRGHVAYVIEDALFCGDTLFGAGCGRLFEGTPEQMWDSLNKITTLPAATRFYCAHEYTLSNLEFCAERVTQNDVVQRRFRRDCDRRRQGLPTIPGTIGEELSTNPFLLPIRGNFRRGYANEHGIKDDPVTVFSHIRAAKDCW